MLQHSIRLSLGQDALAGMRIQCYITATLTTGLSLAHEEDPASLQTFSARCKEYNHANRRSEDGMLRFVFNSSEQKFSGISSHLSEGKAVVIFFEYHFAGADPRVSIRVFNGVSFIDDCLEYGDVIHIAFNESDRPSVARELATPLRSDSQRRVFGSSRSHPKQSGSAGRPHQTDSASSSSGRKSHTIPSSATPGPSQSPAPAIDVIYQPQHPPTDDIFSSGGIRPRFTTPSSVGPDNPSFD